MRKMMMALAATGLTVPVAIAVPADAHSRYYSGRTWYDGQGRLRCKRPNGTTGLIVGAAGGALVGRVLLDPDPGAKTREEQLRRGQAKLGAQPRVVDQLLERIGQADEEVLLVDQRHEAQALGAGRGLEAEGGVGLARGDRGCRRQVAVLDRDDVEILAEPVRLTVHDNRSTMVSFRRNPGEVHYRVHHMFLDAPGEVVSALAAFAGAVRFTTNVSSDSTVVSPVTDTVIVPVVLPAGIVNVVGAIAV